MDPIRHERLFDLVGKIYDCVVEPSRWTDTVEEIRQLFRWHNAILAANSLDGRGGSYQVTLGVPDAFQHIVYDRDHEASALELWGGAPRLSTMPLEEPLVQSRTTSPVGWKDNKFFQAFSVPQGIIDAVGIGLVRDRTMVANITGGRHGSDGPILDEELDGLRVLAPHLRRAVTIAGLFDDARSTAATFAAAMEAISSGLVLVDANLRIVHANRAAQEMLTRGDPIRSGKGSIVLAHEVAPGALAAAVQASVQNPMPARSGVGIPARRSDGSPVLVHVLPLEGSDVRAGVALRATAALFIAPAPGPLNLPGDAIGALFGLTPAEVRIMELVVEGLSTAEAAERLGTAPTTAKTHLLRVYQKTGAHSRDELVRLALASSKLA